MPEQQFLAMHYEANAKSSDRDPRQTFRAPADPMQSFGAGVVGPMGSSSFSLPTVERALVEMEGGGTNERSADRDSRRANAVRRVSYLPFYLEVRSLIYRAFLRRLVDRLHCPHLEPHPHMLIHALQHLPAYRVLRETGSRNTRFCKISSRACSVLGIEVEAALALARRRRELRALPVQVVRLSRRARVPVNSLIRIF